MALSPGTRFGPYEIADEIGAGGMGIVYRATDTTLDREVAVKVLPESMASDSERIARFDREAKTLASLNHPNIATIHGLEKADGTTALVMELVEGPTLADRIAQGALPADEALEIAMQIAEALQGAHGQNIVHRDLKPANIKLRPDGTVKVLDFGIAKALEPENLTTGGQSPMLTTPATQVGVILGTAAYMSPEQARGKAVDERADIWAFGCVLYEMLTGQPAFGGEDVPLTLARVLDRDTDLDALPVSISPTVRQTIQVCLQKDVRKRVADIRDVRLALEGAFESFSPRWGEVPTVQPLWRRALPIAAAVVVTGSLVGITGEIFRPGLETASPAPLLVKRTDLILGVTEPLGNTGLRAHVALSPDGQRLAFAAQVEGTSQLYLRDLDQLEARVISGTEGAFYPFFSPDGEWVAFYTDASGSTLKRVSIRGGIPQTLANAFFSGGGSWVMDDTIIFGTGDPSSGRKLFRIPATGGIPEVLITPDEETGHGRPEVLPGLDAVLFTIRPGGGGSGPARDGSIAVLSLETNEVRTLVESGHTPRYSPTGHIVFVRGGDLWAVPFDAGRLETTGPEVPVVEGVAQDGARGGAAFDFSSDGMLVYLPGDENLSGGPLTTSNLLWVGRDGREEALSAEPKSYWNPRLSPDGRRLAINISAGGNDDIWINDLFRGTWSRLTFNSGDDFVPLWTPDGLRVVFSSRRSGEESGLFWRAADGSGQAERLTASSSLQIPEAFQPDGSRLIFESGGDLYSLSLADESAPQQLLFDAFSQDDAAISPDGRWLAYSSDETGRSEIYVRPLADPSRGGKWQISADGGTEPRWGPDGSELFFRNNRAVLAVSVEGDESISAGVPTVLFEEDYWNNPNSEPNYDVSPDGQRFLMMRPTQSGLQTTGQTVLVAVENWFEELKRLAPPTE